eukprot:TRINITY_DN61817_c0_g1_i1.p1 TRINITY_DN61817_c0_g1~~TRINITY_DN61817_c0_g1_i1.p1  ORF type:complete len:123 (+),score=2.90 TRINITY_DN61817_c0_g1_i1:35-370(+)
MVLLVARIQYPRTGWSTGTQARVNCQRIACELGADEVPDGRTLTLTRAIPTQITSVRTRCCVSGGSAFAPVIDCAGSIQDNSGTSEFLIVSIIDHPGGTGGLLLLLFQEGF